MIHQSRIHNALVLAVLLQWMPEMACTFLMLPNTFAPLVSTTQRQQARISAAGTRLFYLDDKDGRKRDSTAEGEQTSTDRSRRNRLPGGLRPTIPVLGPIPGQPPLLVGAELLLTPPTPMQWQALEESFYLHQKHLVNASTAIGVSAAPLIAIMDNDSSTTKHTAGGGGRYATLAAVVGLSTTTPEGSSQSINLQDNGSFMESIRSNQWNSAAGAGGTVQYKVRLVGVGRALLKDFFYQVPHVVQQAMDEEGHFLTPDGEHLGDAMKSQHSRHNNDDEVEEDDDDDHHDDHAQPTMNIIMAEFGILADLDFAKLSPVHAVQQMSKLARQIEWMHQDRRHLVAGIRAAHARLAQGAARRAEQAQQDEAALAQLKADTIWFIDNEDEDEVDEDLEDHDGLGALFGFTAVPKKVVPKTAKQETSAVAAPKSSEAPVEEERSFVAKLENYGLGSSAASFSPMADLTKVWMETVEPYYSPARRESEEYYYEMLSFVSICALKPFLEPQDLAWSLRCTQTCERLEQAYLWMRSHVAMLKQEADRISMQLENCGEECSDLF